ncbi:MAG: type II toxin-antitoxin system RelB/DinJ family antitoxin, partial [Treponema sp.]|nr:type II toxin-antitoxin system RelB/DinJ family antitoxin [Treponema sp.]
LVQIRVDDKLKDDVSAIYDQLGLDLSTAVRIFFKRTVAEQGIPFAMKLNSNSQRSCTRQKIPQDIMFSMDTMSSSAEENGISDMPLDEINDEIQSVRNG